MEETSESAPPPRRSKREHHPTAKAAAAAAASSSSIGGASADRVTRRSQRHTKASVPDDDSSATDLADSRRSSQRRRVTPSSSRSASRASSPVRVVVSAAVSTSPLPSSQALNTDSDSGGDDAPMLASPALPSHQRRRYRAAASASAGASTTGASSAPGRPEDAAEGKVLGRYPSHECALLCEVMLSQLRKRALAPHVLEDELSPAVIRWDTIAKRLESLHRLKMSPEECQRLWKFLAYGQSPSSSGKPEELLEASDEEDIDRKPQEINARLAEVRSHDAKGNSEEDAEMAAPKQTEEPPQQKEDPPIRLYPLYTLSTGGPEGWQHPFGPKDALPMTFVASNFLKKKPQPQLPVSTATIPASASSEAKPQSSEAATKAIVPSVATAAPSELMADAKTKQAKRQRLLAAKSVGDTTTKKPTVAASSSARSSPSTTMSRKFVPSSTPPPPAKRARSEIEFFALRLQAAEQKATAGSVAVQLSPEHLQLQFNQASEAVRSECQALAMHDVDRFNREVVRSRIWEKAMGGISPKPSPLVAAADAKPTA